jgi:hypothetical protein
VHLERAEELIKETEVAAAALVELPAEERRDLLRTAFESNVALRAEIAASIDAARQAASVYASRSDAPIPLFLPSEAPRDGNSPTVWRDLAREEFERQEPAPLDSELGAAGIRGCREREKFLRFLPATRLYGLRCHFKEMAFWFKESSNFRFDL